MSYTTPPNFAAGAVLTEAQLDILSDDISFLANPPSCRVYNNAAFSVPDATDTPVTFNSERRDTDTNHSTVTNTSRITFTTAGLYLVGGHGIYAANATGTRKLFIRLGGTTPLATSEANNSGGSNTVALTVSTLYAFTAGQYVELVGFQNSGGALNLTAVSNSSPEFWAVFVSL